MNIKDRLARVRNGYNKIANMPVVQRVLDGVQQVTIAIWLPIGMLGSFFLMSFFYGLLGLVNLIIISYDSLIRQMATVADQSQTATLQEIIAQVSPPITGLDIITHSLTAQFAIAIGMIIYALLLANTKSVSLLTLGVIGGLYYAVALIYGTLGARIDIRGWQAAIYVVTAVLAISMASYSAYKEAQAKKEKAESDEKYAELVAESEITIGQLHKAKEIIDGLREKLNQKETSHASPVP